MLKWSVLTIMELVTIGICAQGRIANIDDYLYNHVYKNIAAYNIQYCNFQLNGALKKDIFRDNSDFFMRHLLPTQGIGWI